VLYALEMRGDVRRVLLCMPETVKVDLYLLEVLEVREAMCFMLLDMLEVVRDWFYLPEVQ